MKSTLFLVLLMAVLVERCANVASDQADKTSNDTISYEWGYYNEHHEVSEINLKGSKSKLESELFWPSDTIQVCWCNATAQNLRERDWVKKAVGQTWENVSSLRFVGWGDCGEYKETGGNGVRIRIADVQPATSALGKAIDKSEEGMLLNFTFARTAIPTIISSKLGTVGSQISSAELTAENRKTFIEAQAVHEFGHVIGFSHQQDRPECRFNCVYESQQPVSDALFYTPCDANSVMNYCNNSYLNGGVLSKFDIESVRMHYPPTIVQQDSIRVVYTVDANPSEIRKITIKNSPNQDNRNRRVILASKVYIYLSAQKHLLNRIASVHYRLHQNTFNDMESRDQERRFAILITKVWGNFMCSPTINFKDGSSVTLPGEYIVVKNFDAALEVRDPLLRMPTDNSRRNDPGGKDNRSRN